MKFQIIPIEILKENLHDFLRFHYHNNFEDLKNFIDIDLSQKRFEEIKQGSEIYNSEIKKNLNFDKINIKMSNFKKTWEKFEKNIFFSILKRTGIRLSSNKMTCYIDPFTKLGFYGDYSISISLKLPVADSMMILTHELFHIFYWKKVEELNLLSNKKWEWALSEVAVYLLMKELKPFFWPRVRINLYPEIKNVYDKISHLWNEETFDNFLIKSYNELR